MSAAPPSAFRKAWYRWKTLKLPWRKRFLVGLDLQGNTFWEFRDTLSSHQNRMRRIVQYPSATHYSEIKISPQWHQWLRHTRQDPPSLTEQSQDLVRQERLKVLAAQADARWAAKPSFLDAPGQARGQPLPSLEVKDPGGDTPELTEPAEKRGVRNAVGGGLEDKIQGTNTTMEEALKKEEEYKGSMQVPDHIRHPFNQRPIEPTTPKSEEKQAEDPWKKARGGPSEEWQPQGWDGSIATQKRK